MPPDPEPAPARPLVALTKIALLIALLIAINRVFQHFGMTSGLDIRPGNEDMIHRAIMTTAVLYALALAIPFVPGVEIGLGLIAVLGVKIAPLVYLCTVSGLILAFLIGRLIAPAALIRLALDLRLTRAATLLSRFDATPEADKLAFLLNIAPNALTRFLLRHRYFAVAVAVNVPGNFLVGGGGGIAMMCGASRLFSPSVFALTVMLAVAPVPLAIVVFGPSVLNP